MKEYLRKNGLRVGIIVAAAALIIGLGAAKLSELSEAQEAQETADSAAQEGPEAPDAPEEPGFPERLGLTGSEVLELAAGVVILVVFAFEALSADRNGSKIFLPADVNLLFPAPMRPQSVLMFRLMTQLGTALAASIYLLFQLPNLILNMHLSVWAALAVILCWCFTIIVGKLLQLLLYLICSNHPGAKPWISRVVYAVLALIVLGVVLIWKRGGTDPLTAAVRFLCAPGTRWIPRWGWLKGFCLCAAEGRAVPALVFLGLLLLLGAGLLWVIGRSRADFYAVAHGIVSLIDQRVPGQRLPGSDVLPFQVAVTALPCVAEDLSDQLLGKMPAEAHLAERRCLRGDVDIQPAVLDDGLNDGFLG